MDAETAYHLALNYKREAARVANNLAYWGQYLPPSHIQRLEGIRCTLEVMKGEMRRACANAVPDGRTDEAQILHYLRVIDTLEIA